jgi:dolichyl-diphosphooligosaccharide--protein glycosyltransferase
MEDDEINIDFSKIKNFFKKLFKPETEKEKVQALEKDAETIKQEISSQPPTEKLEEDREKVEEIQEKLEKHEDAAIIVDGEKALIDNKLEEEKKELDKIEEDVESAEEGDEISFDFSKIKSFFKNLKKGFSEEKSSDEDVAIDFRKIGSFIKRYALVFLILIPFIFSISLRSTPANLPLTDDWARGTVYNNIKQQISAQIRSQYPNLPQANINNLVDGQFKQALKEGKSQIEQEVKRLSAYFRSRLQKDGQTYLIAIDPYFWMRHSRNILNNGHPGDELRNPITREPCERRSKDCVPWDTHMYAPLGRPVPRDMLHAYFEAYLHKFIGIFNNNDLMATAFIIPIWLASLCVIPAFFIARRIGGNFGGFIAAFVVALHPAFLTRTTGGFSDTDAYNVLFPLLITWLFLEAFESRNWRKAAILSAVSGFFVSLYTASWGGWWYIFDFLIASLVLYVGIYFVIHRDDIKDVWSLFNRPVMKQTLRVFLVFFFSSMIFTTSISGFGTFKNAFSGPMAFARMKEVGITTVWPNVFTTVAEQNTASLNNVINQVGMNSLVLFLLSILGILFILIRKDNKKDLYYLAGSLAWFLIIFAARPQNLTTFLVLISIPIIAKIALAAYNKEVNIDFKLAIILLIWFTSTTYASTKGIRFMLILVPAFSIGLGIAIGFVYKLFSAFISKNFYLNLRFVTKIIIPILLLLFLNPVRVANSTAKAEIPSMNDAWYESLDKINREAEPDAIINSWWDFGHWFKYIGDRAVTFDGTSQNTPMAHWIGHTLLTNDEDKAIGILRMLDCGSNTAFEKLNEGIEDTAKSVKILHEVVKMSRKKAGKYLLKQGIDKEKADEVLEYTHCDPPENYYITSDDMIGKSGVWGHFGSWNFDRALIYNTLKKPEFKDNKEKSTSFLKERFNYSDDAAERMYYDVRSVKTSDQANSWIAPWPSYASGLNGCRNESNILTCPLQARGVQGTVNIIIDLDKKTADIANPQGTVHPNAVVFPTKGGIKKFSYTNNTLGYSMALVPSGNTWRYIMMLPPLEDSMFTRLYFLEGHGLTKFKKFSDQRSVVGNIIQVWKVDWEGSEKNIMGHFKPKNETIQGQEIVLEDDSGSDVSEAGDEPSEE